MFRGYPADGGGKFPQFLLAVLNGWDWIINGLGLRWVFVLGLSVALLDAAPKRGGSKVFVSEVRGPDATIKIGDEVRDLRASESYEAEGAVFATRASTTLFVVFSNGTAVELRPGTTIEVKRFQQEAFRSNRGDVSAEPSVSDMQIDLAYGDIVVATSRPMAGSRFSVQTRQGEVRVLSGTLVIGTLADATSVAVVTGSCTTYGRNSGATFNLAEGGYGVVMREMTTTQSTRVVIVEVSKISSVTQVSLATEVAETVFTKNTVYFAEKTIAGTRSTEPTSAIAAFDAAPTAQAATEIVAVPVVPVVAPPEITLSASRANVAPGS